MNQNNQVFNLEEEDPLNKWLEIDYEGYVDDFNEDNINEQAKYNPVQQLNNISNQQLEAEEEDPLNQWLEVDYDGYIDDIDQINYERPTLKNQDNQERTLEDVKKDLNELSFFEKNFTERGHELTKEFYQKQTLFDSMKDLLDLPKGILSGASFGFSEGIPGLDVGDSTEGVIGKGVGMTYPVSLLSKIVGVPLQAAAKAFPVMSQPLGALARMLGVATAGGAYDAIEESAEKSLENGELESPSLDTMVEQGEKWLALEGILKSLGFTGRFAKALWDNSGRNKKPIMDVAGNFFKDSFAEVMASGSDKEIAEKAISILNEETPTLAKKNVTSVKKGSPVKTPEIGGRISSKLDPVETISKGNQTADLSLKDKKVEFFNKKLPKESITKLNEGDKAEAYLPDDFEPNKILEKSVQEDINKSLDQISKRATSEKNLGENIKRSAEEVFSTERKEIDKLYDTATKDIVKKTANVESTARSIVEEFNKLSGEGLKTTPEGYKKVQSQLVNLVEDLGYEVAINNSGKMTISKGAESASEIPLSKALEIKKRLNKIIYDSTKDNMQGFLEKPAQLLREDIRSGFGSSESTARKAFEDAESRFGKLSEVQKKRTVKSVSQTQKPESIAKLIKTPSGLSDVKSIVDPQQAAEIEREVLEYINSQSQDKARKIYRELKGSLSDDAKSMAEQIIESKTSPSVGPKQFKRAAIKEKAIDDIVKSTITGERPKVALDLWKTEKGQEVIKEALTGNPNEKEVIKYLSDQSFKDFTTSVISPDGVIDFKKLNTLMKSSPTVFNIKTVGNEEAVSIFKNIETLTDRIKKNLKIENVSKKEIGKQRAKDRKIYDQYASERGKKILSNKAKENSKVKDVSESIVGKKSAKERAERVNNLKERGEQRFKKLAKSKEVTDEKGLIDKLDDIFNSYGGSTKNALALLGISTAGFKATATVALGYKLISALAKNKKVQNALKKAAVPQKNSSAAIKSALNLFDSIDEVVND